MNELVEAPVIEVVAGVSDTTNHPVVGLIAETSQVSKTLPPYQLKVYSPIVKDGLVFWQVTFVGHYQSRDEAVRWFRKLFSR